MIVVATAALKRKKASEVELDRLGGTRLQLEMQVNTLEAANLNAETMAAMKKASDALKVIHGNLYVLLFPTLYTGLFELVDYHHRTMDKVDATMAAVGEQRELANEVAEAISNPMHAGFDLDEVSGLTPITILEPRSDGTWCVQDELKAELDELEQDELNERLNEADHVPVHLPPGASRAEEREWSSLMPPLIAKHVLSHPDIVLSSPRTTAGACSGRRRRSRAQRTTSCSSDVVFSPTCALSLTCLCLYIHYHELPRVIFCRTTPFL